MRRLLSPRAAVFHSGASASSLETKVGSPPIVSLTSSAFMRSSMLRPNASIALHWASEYGLVTRGASQMRAIFMLYSKVVSHASTAPVSGAADCGSGVQASGM